MSIKNTGELREFLVGALTEVKNGTLDGDSARHVYKMASQIHESFYSEIKIMKIRLEAGQSISDLGKLPIK